MFTTKTESKLKRIEDLTLYELDMVYSLSRIGWSYPEIGRRYGIAESDVRDVVENYVELRRECERKLSEERLNQNPGPEPTAKRPRKRRCDAIYATAKDRQAAYRARLREKRRASGGQPSPAGDTDTVDPNSEKLPVTVCQDPVTETSPENSDPQHSTGCSSSGERDGTSESTAVSVTTEAFSVKEELRLIEK